MPVFETSFEGNIDDQSYLDAGSFSCGSLDQFCTSSLLSTSVIQNESNSSCIEGIESYTSIENQNPINFGQLLSQVPTWDNFQNVFPVLYADDNPLNEAKSDHRTLEINDPYIPQYSSPCTPVQAQSQAPFLSPKSLFTEDRFIRNQKNSDSSSRILNWDSVSTESQTRFKNAISSPKSHCFGRTESNSLNNVLDKKLSIDNEISSILASESSDEILFSHPLSIDAPTSLEKNTGIKEKPLSGSKISTIVPLSPRRDTFFGNQFTTEFEKTPIKEIDFEQEKHFTVPLTPQSGQFQYHNLRCESSLDSPPVFQTEPSFQSSLVWSQEEPQISASQFSPSFNQEAPQLTTESFSLNTETEKTQYSTDSYNLASDFSPTNLSQKTNSIGRNTPTKTRFPRHHSSLNDIPLTCQKAQKHTRHQLNDYHRSVSPCLQIRKRKSAKFAKSESPRNGTTSCGSSNSASSNFVNYTHRDSFKILTGVAPSGSSKTKARREKEALEKREKFSQAALRAILAAGGDIGHLAKEGFPIYD